MRKTKIVCTLGPACDSEQVVADMLHAGMNVARINMAHGELEGHRERIDRVRRLSLKWDMPIAVMLDIKGPEIRVGSLKEAVELRTGDAIVLSARFGADEAKTIPVSYDMSNDVRPGSPVMLDDGLIELRVTDVCGKEVHCEVINGGQLKPRKGVNLPGVRTSLPGVTQRDLEHIRFGVEAGIDLLAVSFVRRAEDIMSIRGTLRELGAEHVQIISKIENQEGVDEFDRILEVSDGVMVARGDLGVEIPVDEVPLVQKTLIKRCNEAGKPVITATHMLDSMQKNPRPSRAEASDVANAVLDGTDAVMLSGETAAGLYPVESVKAMASIAMRAETMQAAHHERGILSAQNKITEAVGQAVAASSFHLNAAAILTPTCSGFTARMIAKYRPQAPVIAITTDPHVRRALSLVWGVQPLLGKQVDTMDEWFENAVRISECKGYVKKGDVVVMSAGAPVGSAGTTNTMMIRTV